MLAKLMAFIEELKEAPVVIVYHNPDWQPPTVDVSMGAILRFVSHNSVPEGVLWVVNNGPSGRIITDD